MADVGLIQRINWDDDEAEGLVACFVATPNGWIELVSGEAGARTSSAGSDPGDVLDTHVYSSHYDGGATGDYFTLANTPVFDAGGSSPFTVVWECSIEKPDQVLPTLLMAKSSAGQTFRAQYSTLDSPALGDFYLAFTTATHRCRFQFDGLPGLTDVNSLTGREHHWGVAGSTTGSLGGDGLYAFLYLNGISISPIAATGPSDRTNEWVIGRNSATNTYFKGAIRQVRLYQPRAWSESEAFRFYSPATRDSLFKPRKRIHYFGAAAAAAETLWAQAAL